MPSEIVRRPLSATNETGLDCSPSIVLAVSSARERSLGVGDIETDGGQMFGSLERLTVTIK